MAHYHAAISIDIDETKSKPNNKRDEFHHNNNNTIDLSDLTNDIDVNPCALKKAHIKESIVCHEEAQRLQRMSRDLKVRFSRILFRNFFAINFSFVFQNKVSLTKILKEASLKALVECECIDEELKNLNFNEDDTFDMIETTVTGNEIKIKNKFFDSHCLQLQPHRSLYSH